MSITTGRMTSVTVNFEDLDNVEIEAKGLDIHICKIPYKCKSCLSAILLV